MTDIEKHFSELVSTNGDRFDTTFKVAALLDKHDDDCWALWQDAVIVKSYCTDACRSRARKKALDKKRSSHD